MNKVVKVGGIDYEVKVLFTDMGEAWGGIDFEDTSIRICGKLSKERMAQTLVHEIVHAIFLEAGLDLENEEDIVNRIGLILHQVIKDNDFSWIKKGDPVLRRLVENVNDEILKGRASK